MKKKNFCNNCRPNEVVNSEPCSTCTEHSTTENFVAWYSTPVYINGHLYNKPEVLRWFAEYEDAVSFMEFIHLNRVCVCSCTDKETWEQSYKNKLLLVD